MSRRVVCLDSMIPGVALCAPMPRRPASVDVRWQELGGECPVQGVFHATIGGQEWCGYLRARNGRWALSIGVEDPIWGGVDPRTARWRWWGTDDSGGYMEPDVARDIVESCLSAPVEDWPRGPGWTP